MRFLFALAPLGLVAACAGSGMAPTGTATMPADRVVDITSQSTFSPNAITVDSGDVVEFRNLSTLEQTVTTAADTTAEQQAVLLPVGAAPFDSGVIAPNASYRQTFSTPGTYRYFSENFVAQGMIGTVIVNP